jgi:DNA-binding transcriptional MerR regulator
MDGPGLKEAMRRTQLSRRQLRYLEERGHLGFVARSNGRTVYSGEQIELLGHIARLRALDVSIDEAAVIGGEILGGDPGVANGRLEELVRRALGEVERHSRLARDLMAATARRSPDVLPGGQQVSGLHA